MAIALMACITLRLKLVGLFGSFFLKKYIKQIYLIISYYKTQKAYQLMVSLLNIILKNVIYGIQRDGLLYDHPRLSYQQLDEFRHKP
nr:hypothetical protein [Mucilaginibacter sp. X4EP1]